MCEKFQEPRLAEWRCCTRAPFRIFAIIGCTNVAWMIDESRGGISKTNLPRRKLDSRKMKFETASLIFQSSRWFVGVEVLARSFCPPESAGRALHLIQPVQGGDFTFSA